MRQMPSRQAMSIHEARWCLHANRWGQRQAIRSVFSAISRLGVGGVWDAVVLGVVFFVGLHGLRVSVHLAVTGIIALALYKGLKRWTRRPRPFASDVRIRAWVAPLDEFSFPSGHTLHAVAFSIVAIAYYPMLAWGLLPFAASVALSRVILGLHYPSDVLAALAIGSGLAGLSLWLPAALTTMP